MKINEQSYTKILAAICRYLSFFLLMCFVITCSMYLFLTTMFAIMGIEPEKTEIELAAKLTFGNIIFLSAVCTLIDTLRRKLMVERPVRKIKEAAQKLMQGDLSVRIESLKSIDVDDGFSVVIDCFNRMAEELSGMETLRTDFISNVSHELKTPLSVMQNYAVLLQQPGLSEETRMEYAQTIADTSKRLADMVSNILKLNKLENQKIYPSVRPYDLGEQLCECFLAFENVWEEKELEIETDIDEHVEVNADPELLSLVWNNLFSNAIKFTEPGGTISLSLKGTADAAIVSVTDTGCGISPEVGKHIFDKFYQGDTSHASKGNGLGLALVKKVITITGGDISVSSEVGKGSTFTVTLTRFPANHSLAERKSLISQKPV